MKVYYQNNLVILKGIGEYPGLILSAIQVEDLDIIRILKNGEKIYARPYNTFKDINSNPLGNSIQETLNNLNNIFNTKPSLSLYENFNEDIWISKKDLIINTNSSYLNIINQDLDFEKTGKYSIDISFNYSIDSTNADFISQLLIDNQSISPINSNELIRVEGKDSAGNDLDGRGTDQKNTAYVRYILDVQSIGFKNIKFNIMPSRNSTEASIWNLNINIKKQNNIIEL